MTTCFRDDGHLRQESLCALAAGESMDELQRLEIAEHLSWCDACLQRYTNLLTPDILLAQESTCAARVWSQIRRRTVRLFTSRYATAAAAVALALTLLWSEKLPVVSLWPPEDPSISVTERLQTLWDNSVAQAMDGMRDLFDGPKRSETHQGGFDS